MSRGKHREACTHPSMYISLLPMYAHSCNKVVLVKDGKELAPNSRVWPENRHGEKRRSLLLVASNKKKARPTPPPSGTQSSSSRTSSSSSSPDSSDVAVEMIAPPAPAISLIPACDVWTSEDFLRTACAHACVHMKLLSSRGHHLLPFHTRPAYLSLMHCPRSTSPSASAGP